MYAPALFATWSSLLLAPVLGAVTWTATPYNPPSVPLAVRTPYLSAWLPQGAGTALNAAWPTFWTGSTLGWAGYAKVDGVAYTWMGVPAVDGLNPTPATQKSLTFTSTQSTFVMTAGPVDLTINFLSPVEPSDLVNQSLPLSYYTISASANDGGSHSVQIYADISAEWVTGDNTLVANWSTVQFDNTYAHQVQLTSQEEYTEVSDHIQSGAAYHATLNTQNMTYQTGQDTVVRAQFLNNGALANTVDGNSRAVDDDWPVFAFAHDLGTVTTATEPTVYVIGHIRDPAILYITANNGRQDRSYYWWTRFGTAYTAIWYFINDYANAVARANAFDAKVKSDASAISSDYADLVAISVRQAFGACEITTSKDSSGNWNISDVTTFLKEISSDGNVNTVDVIFPTWPIFLYTNPEMGMQLLLPLLEYQATGQYPNKWAVHDMGASYPQAIGHNDGKDEAMQVEESGNMLIMALSYILKTNDTSIIAPYYSLFDQWAQYLIEDSLIPANQLSTDDFAGTLANQTNLAIKGIVGIRAMAEIASLHGDSATASNYTSIAESYVTQWQSFATAADGTHLTLAYGNDSSWGLSYNLYGDKLLGFNLFPESVYEMQTTWYSSHANEYGVPLDTRHTYTKSDWQIWTSTLMTDTTVRDLFIKSVRSYAADGANSVPLSDWYETLNGVHSGFQARPVVGGHLAHLAL